MDLRDSNVLETHHRKADSSKDKVVFEVRNRDEFSVALATTQDRIRTMEAHIAQLGGMKRQWSVHGFCDVCEQRCSFLLDWMYSDGNVPNYRERLVCEKCNLNNRQRFAMAQLKNIITSRSDRRLTVYLYEQVTPFYSYAKAHLPADIIGSEYLGLDKSSAQVIKGIRHEDAMDLSFPDQSIDVMLSNDVLEHVPDYRKALHEAWRVLAEQGRFVFSIPFYSDRLTSVQRARICYNGHIEHLLPEQYHDNPISENGSLVFYDFGWDIIGECRQTGFSDAYATFYYSPQYGYLGKGGQLLFVALK